MERESERERETERARPVLLLLLLLLLGRCSRKVTSSAAGKQGRTQCVKMPRCCKLNVQICHLLPPVRQEMTLETDTNGI